METECDGLRALASRWSLAGDEKLLDILQNTHKKIITKCQEVNSKLEEMSSSLNDASINLQNVNNKFLALSNSQFVESRVYDDDADVTIEATPVKEPSPKPPSQESELEMIKKSLAILQGLHDPVTILKDSDTETDSDGEDGDRVVLKPKDLYSERPLPYIIGTEAWKNSWHAGLIPEDSDAESGSEGREPATPQYSDSEPEDTHVTSKVNATISETSSELASEQDIPAPLPKATPADIAADLARRLGGQQPKVPEVEQEYAPAMTVSKTIYRPQQPQTGTIFADEPPPLDTDSSSSEEDIFAELHSSRPDQGRVAEDLFGGGGEENFQYGKDSYPSGKDKVPQPRTEPKPALFDDVSDEYEASTPVKRVEEEKSTSKKPVGGISLFGNNKGAESIGAAILKRNQRKSTSEEETDSEERSLPKQTKNVDQTDSIRKEKDIFDDLFAKSANLEKKRQKDVKDTEKSVVKDKPAVDLFSDNLFDDVGDLFTSNVMKNSNKSNQKSIFDDDDDLFAEIAAPAASTAKVEVKSKKTDNKKSIFDSDDELFADKATTVTTSTKNESHSRIEKPDAIANNKPDVKVINAEKPIPNVTDVTKSINSESNIKTTKIAKSIFDSDSDSDIFSDLVKKDTKQVIKPESKEIFEEKTETDDIFKNVPETKPNVLKVDETKNIRSPSLFDDDDDDLFSDTLNVNKESKVKENQKIQDLTREKDELIADNLFNTKQIDNKKDISELEKDQIVSDNLFNVKVSENKKDDSNIEKERIVDITPESIKPYRKEVSDSKEDAIEVNKTDTSNIPSVYEKEDDIFEEQVIDIRGTIPTEDLEESGKDTQNRIQNVIEPPMDVNQQCTESNEIPIKNDALFETPKDSISTEDKTEPIIINNEKFIDGDKTDNEKDALFEEVKDPISKDLFDDEPPVFEKAKEPKRSNNVNALFGDDSEDEALFFRRSEVEDKPENIIVAGQSDRLFGIFHDEPPAIEDLGKDGTDIFDDVIPNTDSDIFQEPGIANTEISQVDKVRKVSEDKLEIKSKTKPESVKNDVMHDFDYIFQEDKPKEVIDIQNKPLDDQNSFSEIKENEFDNLFKSASKIVHEDNDDIFKATSIDSFIKNTETTNDLKPKKVSEEISEEKDIFSSRLAEKEKVTTKSEKDFDSDEELFRTLPKPDNPIKVPNKLSKDETNKVKSDLFSVIDRKTDNFNKTEVNKQHEDWPKQDLANSFEDVSQKPDLEGKKDTEIIQRTDIKTVGRVKSMNLNIDVAKLLPGASPKKQKITSPIERGSEPSLSDTLEDRKQVLAEKCSSESKMVKSISFDGEPNSEILDNKLSKERARIQVKRRPSTRKARREAVRKSVIEIDDSTDNSSSIDDVPRSISEKSSSESPSKAIDFKTNNSSITDTIKSINKQDVIKIEPTTAKSIDNQIKVEPKVTSKIVYILNDEDIFDTKPETGDHLFKTDVAPTIPTLGNMYKAGNIDITKTNDKISKADDDAVKTDVKIPKTDGKIAKPNDKVVKKAKVSIFDSDSDEELFGGRSKRGDDRSKRNDDRSKRDDKKVVKGSLFGDDEDDDLFGVKSKKGDPKPQSSKSFKDEKKPPEPVFNDPLSMLGDD